MASYRKTVGVAVACVGGITLAVAGMAGAAPKTRVDQKLKSVHGTARPTPEGFVKEEDSMSSMDVRKAVQGKGGQDKY
ncbi:hypothetical protein ACEPAG_8587 [Sanghuangporus baumii]